LSNYSIFQDIQKLSVSFKSLCHLGQGKSLFTLLLLALLLVGCSPYNYYSPPVTCPPPPPAIDPLADLLDTPPADQEADRPIEKMGYTIQVGAFSNLDNAVRLEQALTDRGIDAYYFRHESGLYKVRFGNHADYHSARAEAEQLQAQGLIDKFFIVLPEDYAIAKMSPEETDTLRIELVNTARRFLGVPYRWGGTDIDNGVDCSGLTMVCYRLNGLNLPRVSRSQFQSGSWVAKEKLRQGDLVFFATKGGKRVTHVGMYIGNGQFIHAPRTGKTVRVESLSQPFFAKTYVGARTYL